MIFHDWLAVLQWVVIFLLMLPVVVLWLQVLLAWPCRGAGLPAAQVRGEGGAPRCAVLVPAHNEAQGIGATVRQLRLQLAEGDTLLVVADNCNDATANWRAKPAPPWWSARMQRGAARAMRSTMGCGTWRRKPARRPRC